MSDESGRKGTGSMKPGNLAHSRSKNELDELPECDSKRQYGTKHHSFLRAFLWCVLNFIVYFCFFFSLVNCIPSCEAASKCHCISGASFPIFLSFFKNIFYSCLCHDSLSVRLPTVLSVSSFLISSRIPCLTFAVLIPHLPRTTVRRCICVHDILEDLQLLQIPRLHSL
jgi:hypothetical protein